MVVKQPASNTIIVNAIEQDHLIDSVTVFQAGRAEIKRHVNLKLQKGQNHIDIEGLSNYIYKDSVRVQGTGTAVIFDVVFHSGHSYPARKTRPDEDENYATCYRRIQELRKERLSVEKTIEFLDVYGRTLNCQSFSLEDVGSFLDMYKSRRATAEKELFELDSQITQAEKDLREMQNALNGVENVNRRAKITVIVLAEIAGNAELLLSYVVSNASWIPTYEIRASIPRSTGTPSTIALHYRASITQTTGENWPEVALTLSTASPHLGTTMPTLSTWNIGVPAPVVYPSYRADSPHIIRVGSYSGRRSPSYSPTRIIQVEGSRSRRRHSRSPRRSRSRSRSRSSSPRRSRTPSRVRDLSPVARAVPMDVRQADALDAGVLSAIFTIPGRSNIPSDESTHKVLIALLNLRAEPEWVCIPRKAESVFLRCTVSNSSEFTLLPGSASVYMEDNYVSKTRIEHVPPSESFKVPLGTDSALRVTYAPVQTHNRKTSQSGFSFPGRQKDPAQKITAYAQRITIRNSRTTSVPVVRVLDHVPISNESTIRVNVVSPPGLKSAADAKDAAGSKESVSEKRASKEQSWVSLQKGVQARWAPADVGAEGVVEWLCAIGAGREVELVLGWEISAPVGTHWQNL